MAATLWPWLAVAAAGALHGLNPLTGWAFAAWGAASTRPWRLLVPIALGQLGAVFTVAASVPLALRWNLTFHPWVSQAIAVGLLAVLVLHHFPRAKRGHVATGKGLGIGLWSFVIGIGHGAAWLLMPALASLCAGDAPGREITASGSLWLAVAAVGVHLGAMLATTAVMAAVARCLFARK